MFETLRAYIEQLQANHNQLRLPLGWCTVSKNGSKWFRHKQGDRYGAICVSALRTRYTADTNAGKKGHFSGPMLHKRCYTGTHLVMVKHLLFATAGFETPPPPILATKKRIEIHHDPGSPLNCEN